MTQEDFIISDQRHQVLFRLLVMTYYEDLEHLTIVSKTMCDVIVPLKEDSTHILV